MIMASTVKQRTKELDELQDALDALQENDHTTSRLLEYKSS